MAAQIALRDITDSDIKVFFEHQKDPESIRIAAFAPRSEHSFRTHWTKLMLNSKTVKQTVTADGRVAGYVASFERAGLTEVCYWLGREFWGRGVATAALAQLLPLVATRPLHARVIKHNIGSVRVLEKCGFKIEREDTLTNAHGEKEEEFVLRLDA